MKAREECRGCKYLAHDEYWCMSGRSIQAYCKKHDKFVRFVKDCKDKELKTNKED